MSITLTVKMVLVLFLLCSGFFHSTFGSNRLRYLSFNSRELNQSAAVTKCKEANETLVTLYDEEDIDFTESFGKGLLWVGMQRTRNITWSDSNPVRFNKSVTATSKQQTCVAIVNGNWTGFNCSDRKPFMCYKGDIYALIEKDKDWCQARQYCKTYFHDLVSIHNETQNEDVIEKGKNTSFWIGLMHDEWQWEDNSCSTFRKWNKLIENEKCSSQYRPSSITTQSCDMRHKYICSKGSVRIKVIKKIFTWEEAFEYCKAHHTGLLSIETDSDQMAVEQWLNTTNDSGPLWIGLRQSRVFGFWIWTNGMTVSKPKWKNNLQPELPLSNHCGVIEMHNNNYMLTDKNCLYPLYFLCEEQIVYMN